LCFECESAEYLLLFSTIGDALPLLFSTVSVEKEKRVEKEGKRKEYSKKEREDSNT